MFEDDEYLNDREEFGGYHRPYDNNPDEAYNALHQEQVEYMQNEQLMNDERYEN